MFAIFTSKLELYFVTMLNIMSCFVRLPGSYIGALALLNVPPGGDLVSLHLQYNGTMEENQTFEAWSICC